MTTMEITSDYLDALSEAARQIRKGREVPETVIEKAIGKRPNLSNSPDADTMFDELRAHNRYHTERAAFLNAASQLANP